MGTILRIWQSSARRTQQLVRAKLGHWQKFAAVALMLVVSAWWVFDARALVSNVTPNGDVTAGWATTGGTNDATCAGGTHCDFVDEGATQSTADYVGTGTGGSTGEVEEFTLGTISDAGTITQVKVYIYAWSATFGNGGTLDDVDINLRVGGTLQTATRVTPLANGGSWYSATFTGSWTQTQLDGMQAHLTRIRQGSGSPASQDDDVRVASVYAEVTHTGASTFVQSAYRWFNNVNAGNFTTVTSNPTSAADAAYATVQDGTYLYTGGYSGSNGIDWRIEKRNLTDGVLVSGFGTSGVVDVNASASDDRVWGIADDGTNLYVAGHDSAVGSTNQQWRIEKRLKSTGALVGFFGSSGVVQSNPTSGHDQAQEIVVDSSYIYIAGFDATSGDQWRIEKRDKDTGALVSGFGTGGVVTVNYSANPDRISAMTIDSTGLYLGGYDNSPGTNTQIRIEKRDLTTGALISGFGSSGVITENIYTSVTSVVEDSVLLKGLVLDNGSLYVAGTDYAPGNMQWRIEKRDKDTGALVSGFGSSGVVQVNPSSADDSATTVRVNGSYLYVGGSDRSLDSGSSQFRIEKRNVSDGALVSGFGSSGVVLSNPSTGHDELRDMAITGNNLFAIGYDFALGNYQWRIEKRNVTTGNGPSDDSSPRAAQDAAVTSVAINEQVRLRTLVRIGTNTLSTSEKQFKLQFAERSGTCDTSFTGETYADVTTTTAIALYDNTSLSDATATYINLNDPTDGANPVVTQEYDESGSFTNSVAAIPVSSNGLWDISLYNRSAPESKTYCFRVVESGGAVLGGYTVLPELSTPPPASFTQANYRWFNNTDSTTPGSVMAAQDTAANIAAQTPFRLRSRIAVDSAALAQSGQNFKLQYAEKSGVCDVGFSGETYGDVYTFTSSNAQQTAGAAANDTGVGSQAWTSPGNATADDAANASVSTTTVATSNYLLSSSHGFAIPSNAIIDGIELIVDRSWSGFDAVESNIRLVKGGVIGTTDRARTTQFWENSVGNWGGSTDLWGTTWTPADINASNFGAAVAVGLDGDGSSVSAAVDYIAIKVYYRVPDTGTALSYHDNASAADAATISSSGNDPTNASRPTVFQNYRETDPFTNAVASIPVGSDGLWDFALTTSSAAAGKTYCLRIVESDNTLLGTYSQIPEITISGGSPTLDQMTRGGQSVVNGVKNPFSF